MEEAIWYLNCMAFDDKKEIMNLQFSAVAPKMV